MPEVTMIDEPRLLPDEVCVICTILEDALLEIRTCTMQGAAKCACRIADAVHNLPRAICQPDHLQWAISNMRQAEKDVPRLAVPRAKLEELRDAVRRRLSEGRG